MEDTQKFGMMKLGDNNYHVWYQRTQMWLRREDLWDVIGKPTPTTPDAGWIKRDEKARASIGLLIQDKFLNDIKHEESAWGAWHKLQQIHSQNTVGARLLLYRKIFAARYTRGNNMVNHITDILGWASRLEDTGFKLLDEVICSALLGSLPREYDTLVTTIEGRTSTGITVEYVREKILEEHRRKEGDPSSEPTHTKALFTGSKPPRNHTRKPVKCFYCQKVGHIRKDCRLLKNQQAHGDFVKKPKNSQPDKVNLTQYFTRLDDENTTQQEDFANNYDTIGYRAMNTKVSNKSRHPGLWIIDTGAADHMCNDISRLHNTIRLKKPLTVITASGEMIAVTTKGDCSLSLQDTKGRYHNISLNQVLYVPALTENLLSIVRLDQDGYNITFTKKESWLETKTTQMRLGYLSDKLYIHDPKAMKQTAKANICRHIWHSRLGHRNQRDIDRMSREEMTEGLKMTTCNNKPTCNPCIASKMSDKPYTTVTHAKSTKPFQFLHSDLCGPITPSSLGHNSYILSIVDDYSRYTTIYLLRTKDQATSKIAEFIEQGINKFHRRPEIFFSDGGGEYCNQPLDEYLKSRGIKHLLSLPYTPEENGTVERHNRTMMESIRTLINQTRLPSYMWGEMAGTATYLLNLVGHRELPRSPHELWHGTRPQISHLRTIGSRCHFLNPRPHKHKLEDRGLPGILVGYGTSTSFYRVWCISDRKIYQSRRVIFQEETCTNLDEELTQVQETANLQPKIEDIKSPEETNTNSNEMPRRSTRSNIGKSPMILTYDQLGESSPAYQDWFTRNKQTTENIQESEH